jgi:hypothetical protein
MWCWKIIYRGNIRSRLVSPCMCRILRQAILTCLTTATDHVAPPGFYFNQSPHASEILTEPLRWEAYMPRRSDLVPNMVSFSSPYHFSVPTLSITCHSYPSSPLVSSGSIILGSRRRSRHKISPINLGNRHSAAHLSQTVVHVDRYHLLVV